MTKMLFFCPFLQRDIDALKKEVSKIRLTIAERRKQFPKEIETHAQIKKDIEVCSPFMP